MVRIDEPRVQETFATVRGCVVVYGVLTAVVLVALAVLSIGGTEVTTFMWVRAVLLVAFTVPLHRMAGSAARGSRRVFERLRTLCVIMPIAIVAVDLIPGVCPIWYAAIQAVCTLPVIRAAFLTRSLRAVFAG